VIKTVGNLLNKPSNLYS